MGLGSEHGKTLLFGRRAGSSTVLDEPSSPQARLTEAALLLLNEQTGWTSPVLSPVACVSSLRVDDTISSPMQE
jgi:hypothetical protein